MATLENGQKSAFLEANCRTRAAGHRFVLDELMRHIEEIEARISRFDTRLLAELESERNALALLQTIPGVDLIGAAMLLVEVGTDMEPLVARIAWPRGSASA